MTLRQSLESIIHAGHSDRINPEWWARTNNVRTAEIVELVAAIERDWNTRVVPVGDLHRLAEAPDGK